MMRTASNEALRLANVIGTWRKKDLVFDVCSLRNIVDYEPSGG